ncbi:nuclear transport factor 2 family protein [Streptomyces sp. MZ04]|uniref:nuclear transport factor 2 family protein n=1 Tax=Streptomyces sp. MZ04 TaxID=2559236 RepID=UPI00107EA071|nr:nuclear transport factor 2 family protein [Streptomyces sp. MZ04]TGB14474.1 nuclear transport factor 2 family protein [Streptomyces sp. MZ04]
MKAAKELWESVYELVDAGNTAGVADLCDPELEIRTASQGKIGAQRLSEMFAQQHGLYLELERRVDGIIESADGSALSAELTLSGVPKGTEQRLTWNVVETIRVDAGRIVSWHAMLDRTGLVQQIRALQG